MKTLSIIRLVLAAIPIAAGVTLTRAAVTAEEASAFVRDFYAAYNATGSSHLADFYATDATFTDPTFGLELKGREQIGQLLTAVLAKYESVEHEISHTIIARDDLVVEGTMIGRLAGKTVRVRFTSIFHFADGRISAQRDMFDVLHFYSQLGIVPPQFRPKPVTESKTQT